MFTGIIETSGKIKDLSSNGGDWQIVIESSGLDFSDVELGDSISVSGTCLTVITKDAGSFTADVSNETMRCTSLGSLKKGDQVNLEKAMTPSSRLGGHIVSGHVDGLAELIEISEDGRSTRLTYKVPKGLARYIAAKGSVCLDGVSLTVNEVSGCEFNVNIIPHTTELTTIHLYSVGRKVNLEVDVVSRYLERLITADADVENNTSLTLDNLRQAGFVKS